jgi:hypothetical protein
MLEQTVLLEQKIKSPENLYYCAKAVNHIIEFKIYRIDNMERKIYRMIKFIERKYIELYNIERINKE